MDDMRIGQGLHVPALFAEANRGAVRQRCLSHCAMMHATSLQGDNVMLKWALIFFIISLVAGVFGFTGIASGAAAVAKILFYIAVALFLLFLVLGVIALKAVK
jgi:uncharacterized membrane protein YtjA (UPF0391 family)